MERITRRDGREGALVLILIRRVTLTHIPTGILMVIPESIPDCTSDITADGDMAVAGAGAKT
jgi:hypothetical protein